MPDIVCRIRKWHSDMPETLFLLPETALKHGAKMCGTKGIFARLLNLNHLLSPPAAHLLSEVTYSLGP
jgi:hypothetical protein